MPRKKNKKTEQEVELSDSELKNKVASIGDFAQKKPDADMGAPDPDAPIDEDGGGGEKPPEEERAEPSSSGVAIDVLTERVLHAVTEIGARGLGEAEKKAFMEEFRFWNGIMFEMLGMGENLKSTIESVHIKMTPMKATLIYGGGTLALVALLRPDIVKNLIAQVKGKKKGPIPDITRTQPQEQTPKPEETVDQDKKPEEVETPPAG